MRLTRAIWAVLLLVLVAALTATWVLTRPDGPEPAWVGAVSAHVGDGHEGSSDGALDEARLSEPFGLAATADGQVYVSDAGSSHRIRRIGTDGSVTTVAGGGRGFEDGRGDTARFATPSGIALAPDGSLVVADTGNHAIRRVTVNGVVTTIAGDGFAGYVDGPSAAARFNAPVGVAVDAAGRILVADTYNDRVRVIDSDGEVRTLAGGDIPGSADGPGPQARFDTPCGVAVAANGRVLVADTGNGLIRSIAPDGQVSVLTAATVGLERPIAVASDSTGDLYIVDERGAVVLWTAAGEPRLLAGGSPGFADGVAGDARFRRPSGIALLPPASGPRAGTAAMVIADAGNAMVRLVRRHSAAADTAAQLTADTPRAVVRTRASTWPWTMPVLPPTPRRPVPAPAFDADAFARTPLLWPIAPLDGPHEVAGTFGEARGEAGRERFHAGLDVRDEQGTRVHAVRDGIVASPISTAAFDTLNESIRIGPLTYVHLRVGRARQGTGPRVPGLGSAGVGGRPDTAGVGAGLVRHGAAEPDLQRFAPVYDDEGSMVRMRVKRGASFATGDVVGTVNGFNHVHLNVGWPGEEHNPLRFRLVQFRDGIAPTIAAAGVRLFDEAWSPLNPDRPGALRGRGRARRPTRLPPIEPVVVRGRVRIVVDAWDQADGNVAYRRLGIYAVGYSVRSGAATDRTSNAEPAARRRRTSAGLERRTSASEAPAPVTAPSMTTTATQQFDRVRRDADAAQHVYATGSGIPVYGASRTQFLYVATTDYHDGVATPGFWDTTLVEPGEYVLRVFVSDFSGNRTTRDLKVLVVPLD